MIAYRAETALVGLLRRHLAYDAEARAPIRELFVSGADLEPDDSAGTLTIRIRRMVSPVHDRATTLLVDELTTTHYRHPETGHRLLYQLFRPTQPDLKHAKSFSDRIRMSELETIHDGKNLADLSVGEADTGLIGALEFTALLVGERGKVGVVGDRISVLFRAILKLGGEFGLILLIEIEVFPGCNERVMRLVAAKPHVEGLGVVFFLDPDRGGGILSIRMVDVAAFRRLPRAPRKLPLCHVPSLTLAARFGGFMQAVMEVVPRERILE